MELKNLFNNSPTETLDQNKELLEEYDLLNILGSPSNVFLKFLKSKGIEISKDEITVELIEEFENSKDSINIKLAKIQKQKEIIYKQGHVWINITEDSELIGTDLILNPNSITIDITDLTIPYDDMIETEITEGGWSKNKFMIYLKDGEYDFEINEDLAIPLKEVLDEKIKNQNYDEIDELLELYSLFEDGKISEEELDARKAVIYSYDVFCTNCGAKLDLDSKFCPSCGHKI